MKKFMLVAMICAVAIGICGCKEVNKSDVSKLENIEDEKRNEQVKTVDSSKEIIEEKTLNDFSENEILEAINKEKAENINYDKIVFKEFKKENDKIIDVKEMQVFAKGKEKINPFRIIIKENNLIVENCANYKNDDLIKKINNINNVNNIDYSLSFKPLNEFKYINTDNERYKSASVIKIFIMIEVYNKVHKVELDLKEEIKLTKANKVGGAGSLSAKPEGTKVKIEELVNLMMKDSDNAATNMLIDYLGIENINKTIKEIGCVKTTLQRKMMDTKAIEAGFDNYTSTMDLMLVFSNLYNGSCISEELDLKMLDLMTKNKNKTKIKGKLPKNIKVAHKTGELSRVENDAGIIYTEKGPYILCILTKNSSSEKEKEFISDISKEIYYEYIKVKSE